MELEISPLAPAQFADLSAIEGVDIFTTSIGAGYKGRENLLLAKFCEGTIVAGVFTTSKCASAPIDWCKAYIDKGVAPWPVGQCGQCQRFCGESRGANG